MSAANQYRAKAAEFSALARTETDPAKQTEYARMAASYLRLAEMADRNSTTNVIYDPPMLRDGEAPA